MSNPIVSKVGVHCVGSQRNGYGPFIQTINTVGRKLSVVKVRDDFGAVDEPLKYWPDVLCIGCKTEYDGNMHVSPQVALNQILSMYQSKPVIKAWEYLNEVDGEYQAQADLYIGLLPLLAPYGLTLCMFNCATGTPHYPSADPAPYQQIARACKFAKQNGFKAVLGLHEYIAPNGDPADQIGRYKVLADYLESQGALIPIVITEWLTETYTGDVDFMNKVKQFDPVYMPDARVIGCATWTLGGGGWQGSNFQTALPQLGEYIATVQGVDPVPPIPPDPPPTQTTAGDFAAQASLTDGQSHVWKLGTQRIEPGYAVLKDGVPFGGGYGVALLYYNQRVYVTNSFADWYEITATGYIEVDDDPRQTIPPIEPPIPDEKTLPVPWVGQNTSQVTDDYSNSDCGPASLCMWLKYRGVNVTVDDVSRATGKPAGYTYTVFADLDRAANVYGLDLTHKLGNLTLDLIRAEIDAKRPVIVLVDYPALPKRWDAGYMASHWIVVKGHSEGKFVYNDPYWPDRTGGENISISDSQLTKALQDVSTDDNTPMQGILQATAPAPAGSAILGVHCRANGGDLPSVEQQSAQQMQINVKGYKFMTGCSQSHYNAILSGLHYDPAKCMTRLFWDASGVNVRPTAEAFVDLMRAGIQDAWNVGIRAFELLNEVNLYHEWKPAWGGANGFVSWALQVINILRSSWSDIQIISPGLAPVGDMAGVAEHTDKWINAFVSGGLFSACNYAGAHAYWRNRAYMTTTEDGLNFRRYYNATVKNIWITECCNNQTVDSDDEKGRQYKDYINYLRNNDPRVERAYIYVMSSTTTAENDTRQTLVRNGQKTGIVTALSS